MLQWASCSPTACAILPAVRAERDMPDHSPTHLISFQQLQWARCWPFTSFAAASASDWLMLSQRALARRGREWQKERWTNSSMLAASLPSQLARQRQRQRRQQARPVV